MTRRISTSLAMLGLAAAVIAVPTPSSAEGVDNANAEPEFVVAPYVIEVADDTLEADPAAMQVWVDELEADLASDVDQAQDTPVAGLQAAAVGGQITAEFQSGTPTEVRDVVNRAVADWNAVLSIPAGAPIVVSFDWETLPTSVLGQAGPTLLVSHQPGLPTTDLYPLALANALAGYDIRPDLPEIQVTLASNLYNVSNGWYAGQGAVPSNRRDLYSTVLHELGHGLGFIGSAKSSGSTAYLPSSIMPYDRLARYNGSTIVGTGSSNINSALRSNNLYTNIGGEQLRELYAPSSFQSGSSFSHFDESYSPGQPGSMMTPALGIGQTDRAIDAAILGVMSQIGWGVTVGPVLPTLSSVTAGNQSLTPSWSVDLTQQALPPIGFEISANRTGASTQTTTASALAQSATVNGLTNFVDYDVTVTAVGADGSRSSAQIQTSGTPRLLKASGTGLARTLTWDPMTAPGSNSVTYTVQRSKDEGSFHTIGSTSGTSLVDSSLTPGVYQYRVTGSSSAGTSSDARSQFIGITTTAVRPFELDGQVARLYEAYLDRTPDAAGMAYWLQRRAQGESLASLAAAFEVTPEFTSKYGNLTNEDFVNLIYDDVIDRTPDVVGFNYWLGQLNSGLSRSSMMIGFSEGSEFITVTGTTAPATQIESAVYRVYVAYFLRAPDTTGFNHWLNAANNGMSLSDISANFEVSDEFQARYGALSDAEFVSLVYANVLTRNAEGSGQAYWVGELNKGVSRGDVMLGFANSEEFLLATGTLP